MMMTTETLLPAMPAPPALTGPAITSTYLAERALARLGADPFFMASALVAYRRATDADLTEVAAFLGCPVDALARLALYPRPQPARAATRARLARMAAASGAQPGRLAALLQFHHR
jgi:hypothetical protein